MITTGHPGWASLACKAWTDLYSTGASPAQSLRLMVSQRYHLPRLHNPRAPSSTVEPS